MIRRCLLALWELLWQPDMERRLERLRWEEYHREEWYMRRW